MRLRTSSGPRRFYNSAVFSTIPNGHCSHGKNKSIVTEAAQPFDRLKEKGFEIEFHAHAHPILFGEFSEPLAELATVLDRLELPIPEIIGSGGGETKFPQRTRKCLAELGWKKHNFEVTKVVDGTPRDST